VTTETIASLRNVSKLYQGTQGPVPALQGLNLDIGRGEYVAIMGPSGSGKTTLLNLLCGIDRPTSGEVYVDGERIDELGEHRLLELRRKKIGYVFQEARLLPSLTAIENVMLPGAFSDTIGGDVRQRALELLKHVGLEPRAHHLVHQLSGGEAQRVCIARAMLSRPMLVLADEPTGSLDHATRLAIVHHLEAFNAEGNTLVMVTHDPELAGRAGRTAFLRDGQIEYPHHRRAGDQGKAVSSS
jgi:putative ABC transport system ATP-binding protein